MVKLNNRRLAAFVMMLSIAALLAVVTTTEKADAQATIAVALSTNAAGNVDRFDLSHRLLASSTWSTQSLPVTIVGTRAEGNAVFTVNPGEYVFRGEAFDSAGTVLGNVREVRVTAILGSPASIEINLDIADMPGDEDGVNVGALVSGQNGADLVASSITNHNPTDVVSTTITIDATNDAEGDAIRTGFVANQTVMAIPEFFDGNFTSVDLTIPAGFESEMWAITVDPSNMGTAHRYRFDPALSTSHFATETWRVNDIQDIDANTRNDVVVMSNDLPSFVVFADFNDDQVWDFGLAGTPGDDRLLSWGPGPTPTEYTIRSENVISGVVTIGTLDFATGATTTVLE